MIVLRRRAVWIGVAAIAAILAQEAFNSVACYQHSLGAFLFVSSIFVGIPLVPALASLATANPLRAVGACVLFSPWLGLTYYTDCVRPYTGGGASMVHVAVLLWGTPSALLGALLTGPVLRMFNIPVAPR